MSDACYGEWCEDCDMEDCCHHCHDSVWFDAFHINWRRLETVAVTAVAEDGRPVL